ncbi:MAG: ABC transporter permease, partial [Bacteroidetes bacterium]|nr:ABC transporter permease [Bacteroidota bacterium]
SAAPMKALHIPNLFDQLVIFVKRDVLAKIHNTQYLLINLLEAPLLAFILAFIVKYTHDLKTNIYLFSRNENIPAYLFMGLIVALFMGLTVSAEEIIRDRKLLKRESFLNLSRSSYLYSKVLIMFTISAIQTLLFALVGNHILEIQGMHLVYWMTLFTTACFANLLGLNISSGFNSAVTIYIMIPLLLIPQMVLSGAMFSFDKLNQYAGGGINKVPMIADLMVSRWAFEGIVVHQYKHNAYEEHFFEIEKEVSANDYQQLYLIPTLKKKVIAIQEYDPADSSDK